MVTNLDAKIDAAVRIYECAAVNFQPARIVHLYSGGHDSVVATHLAHTYCGGVHYDIADEKRLPSLTMHINTGIQVVAEPEHEIPSPEEWVTWMALEQHWNLRVYRAIEHVNAKGEPDPQDYLAIAKLYDFPGPAGHGTMYIRLKERAIQRMVRDTRDELGIGRKAYHWKTIDGCRWSFRVMLVAGCRKAESTRRMGTTRAIDRQGTRVWVNPIEDFTQADIREYMERHGLPESPIAKLIHKSGECLCGAFAQPGELKEYELLLPKTAEMIHQLQDEVRAAGHSGNWGCRPYKGKKQLGAPGPLCQGCVFNGGTQ
jgi:3'-phosphoadenosine 5'-phosphosulfate sulfotransferase (PAPS reductase)/FAD synthetase